MQSEQAETLRNVLLSIAGDSVMIPPSVSRADETLIEMVIEAGYLHHGPSKLTMMQDQHCHQNASLLFYRQEVLAIGTGYGLYDRIWWNHSWGIGRAGEIIETTELRQKYFGVVLFGSSAKSLAELNCVINGKHVTPGIRYLPDEHYSL